MTRHIDRIMQAYQQGLARIVRQKNCREGEVAYTRPFEWPGDCPTTGNLLRRLAIVFASLHGVELRLRIIRQRSLIAKSAGPRHQRGNRIASIGGG